MRELRVKAIAGVVLVVAVVCGVTAGSAVATRPDLHIALGEAFSVTATAEDSTAAVTVATLSGNVITGTGYKVVFTWSELNSVGSYPMWILNALKSGKKCKTPGDAAGNVLWTNEVNLVFVLLSPLTAALFYSVPKTKIECEGVNVTIQGVFLGSYNGTLNAEITEFRSAVKGSKGKEELSKYFNEAGTEELEAVLLTDPGTGFTKADIDLGTELKFKTNKMIEILG